MSKLAYTVYLTDEDGNTKAYGPEDTVPAAVAKQITNASAWADDEAVSDDPAGGEGDGGQGAGDNPPDAGYSKLKKADLEAEISIRNEGRGDDDKIVVPDKAKVADLIAALEADDHAGDTQ